MDYTVKEGDTLSEILYNITGDGSAEYYNQVAQANNIANSDKIYVGQVIHIDESKISSTANINSGVGTSQSTTSNIGSSTANGGTDSANRPSTNGTANRTEYNNGSSFSQVAYDESAKQESTSSAKPTSAANLSNQSKNDNQFKQVTLEDNSSVSNTAMANTQTTQSASPTTSSSSRGNYRFTRTIEDDDDIVMDIDAARDYIEGTMDADLGQMCKSLSTLVQDLTAMQDRQYSTTGTAVDEDYKDFEAITKALSDFLTECNMVLDQIVSYINSCYLTLNN